MLRHRAFEFGINRLILQHEEGTGLGKEWFMSEYWQKMHVWRPKEFYKTNASVVYLPDTGLVRLHGECHRCSTGPNNSNDSDQLFSPAIMCRTFL